MINIMGQAGSINYNIKQFVCDTLSDIAVLPTDCAMGSYAIVIENGEVYMLNGKKEWKPLGVSSN